MSLWNDGAMAIWGRLVARPASGDARRLEALLAAIGVLTGVVGILIRRDPVIVAGFVFVFLAMVVANIDLVLDWRRRRRKR